ncbi:MAG TPA: serine/threonine-protein kinase [Patescibacteria group bacterium]|nr:serine/threonine-protein kinase [Patescibacteria group bacterium]
MKKFTPERWRTLNTHLDAILDLPDPERAVRLSELRAGDPDLAADLESLLEEHRALQREQFLAAPVEPPSPAAQAGQTLGPYTLIAPLGEGGMGEVWLADQQEPVRRQVAIKVIKSGMDTAQVVARFEAERQALALMDHPAVAKVFEAGSTPQGRPYFAMEYVRGVAINEHCDRQRLTTSERLGLFRLACDGVQHAHQKAVIHRDLKPSNVLVTLQDGKPVPKIIDFGVAKATAQRLTERTLATALGAMIGTPEYMSPEQADLSGEDVDTRTDVYSLGVMLYELLVGVLPFDAGELRRGGLDDVRRRIREEEPRTPSARLGGLVEAAATEKAARRRVDAITLRRQVKGELDWIVMKALEKDRARRYGSPAELAADIGRHLDHLPVLAGPPGVGYRARKFVRRHRVGVAFATLAVIGLAGFGLAMALQSQRIARERDRANREAATANRTLSFLAELFEVSDPSEARGSTVTAREILDRGAAKIDAEMKDEPLVRAKLLLTLGEVYQSLGLEASARPLLETSLSLRRGALGAADPETLDSMSALATLLQDQGKLGEAEAGFRAVLAGRRAGLGVDHIDTLVAANNLGLLLQQEDKLREAETYLREALDGERRTLSPDDPEILTSLNNLGLLLQDLGRPAEAEPYAREVLDACRRTIGDDHPQTLTAINNLALVLGAEGKLAEAEPLWREALATRRRVLGNDHRLTLLSVLNLGQFLRDSGRLPEAETSLREALDGCRRVLGPEHPRTLSALNAMANLESAQGKLREAEASHRSCLATRRRTLGDDHQDTLDSMEGLASVLHDELELAGAEALFRESVERAGKALGPDHPITLGAVVGLGDLRTSQGRLEEAERLLGQALASVRRVLPPTHRLRGRALSAYGRCLTGLGRYDEAEAALVEARGLLEKAAPVLLPGVARNLADLHARRDRRANAGSRG